MVVSFVLPPITPKVVGGLKVIYQYANYLAEKNCSVILYYRSSGVNSRHLPERLVRFYRHCMLKREPKWFHLDPRIKKLDFLLPSELKGDVIVASDVGSVEYVISSDIKKKYYFIQDFENWSVSDEAVYKTYQMGMTNIVVSKWLKTIVDENSGRSSVYIPNGIDLSVFRVSKSVEFRGITLAMLFHHDKRKGCDVGMNVLHRLKKRYPDLKAFLFGSPERPKDFPDWIEYTCSATQEQVARIDNNAAVFLCPSRQEGYGLTGLEGMACGCALVTTDCKGIMEYAVDGYNALVCEVDDEEALFQSCCRLFDDKKLRMKISDNALIETKKFDINVAMENYYEIITQKRCFNIEET